MYKHPCSLTPEPRFSLWLGLCSWNSPSIWVFWSLLFVPAIPHWLNHYARQPVTWSFQVLRAWESELVWTCLYWLQFCHPAVHRFIDHFQCLTISYHSWQWNIWILSMKMIWRLPHSISDLRSISFNNLLQRDKLQVSTKINTVEASRISLTWLKTSSIACLLGLL